MVNMDVLVDASIEQIEELALAEGSGAASPEATGAAEEQQATQQAVGDGEAAGATGDVEATQGDDAAAAEAIAMKSGKGTIPYAVLKETRDELARTKQLLDQIKRAPIETASTELSENHASQLSDIGNGFAELGKKFESGDIDWDEYQSQMVDLQNRKDALIREEMRVQAAQEIAQKMQEQSQEAAMSAWKETVNNFLGAPRDGIDYHADQKMYDELDAMVRALGNDPANNDKDYQWFLDTAHAIVMVKHGRQAASQEQPPDQQKKHQARTTATPPFTTLSDLPGGEIPNREGIEQVSQLSGEALTNRFINDPSQIDKVLNSLAM